MNLKKELEEISDIHNQYLPEQYTPEPQPYYPGDGQLSVGQLEELCRKFSEHTHQQAVIKQNIMTKLLSVRAKALNLINNLVS
jgi:hypothetical protein